MLEHPERKEKHMKTHLVYDRKSGRIVHAHAGGGKARTSDEIMRLVHRSLDRSQLEIVEVESADILAGKAYRVNPNTKKLEPAKEGAISSGGFASPR
jgi:hypothetical protein